MFALLERAGFARVRSAVVPRFRFRKPPTQNSAEAFGVKAVMLTARKLEFETDAMSNVQSSQYPISKGGRGAGPLPGHLTSAGVGLGHCRCPAAAR